VRKRIHAGTLRAQPFGRSFMVWLPDDAETVAELGPEPGPVPRPEHGPEPIEAAYRVTSAEIEQAVSRTSAQYMGDLRTMLAEVGKVYEGQIAAKDAALAAKDEALTTKDQVIGTQAETIAELRRRAAQAEAERDRLTAAQAALDAPGTAEEESTDNPSGASSAGFWARVRRVFGGGE